MKKIGYAVAALAVVAGTAAVAPTTAQAAGRNGVCEAGEFCLYYNSGNAGSVSDFTGSVSDYGSTQPSCYDFKGDGAGKGLCVKNEAASVWNRTNGTVTVFYNSGYAGASQSFAKDAKADLNATLKNENAGHRFGGTTPPVGTTNLSFGLYSLSGGRITCGYDGYVNTPGKHEGIDIARGIGSPVRALVAGQVINIVRGANGGGLSTIAVYNASLGKTIVYLHSAPLSGLSVGQNVARGQQIATEAYRGISSSSAAHTHVEMRPGRQTLAAKSVNDYTLSNPDPTSFWNAQGYLER